MSTFTFVWTPNDCSPLRRISQPAASEVTGEEPSMEEVKGLTEELHKRSAVPANVMQTLETLPIVPA